MKSIVQLIHSQIIPWIMPSASSRRRIIVAREVMHRADLPEGVSITTRKLHGERTICKASRIHNNQRFYTALWPQDNLQETTIHRISCVMQGTADHLHGKYVVRFEAGNFLILPPGIPFQRNAPFLYGKNRKNGYCVLMHAYAYRHNVLLWLTTSSGDQHTNDYSDNYLMHNADMAQLLKKAVDEAAANQKGAELICQNCLTAFFTIAAREIESENYTSFDPRGNLPTQKSALNFGDQVHEYIEANCHRSIKVEDVARHMYMSNSHFFRQMQTNDLRFTELLTHYRIEIACRLLRETDLTVTAIKNKVSYKSYSHFQRIFRAHMGCTPIEYRHKPKR